MRQALVQFSGNKHFFIARVPSDPVYEKNTVLKTPSNPLFSHFLTSTTYTRSIRRLLRKNFPFRCASKFSMRSGSKFQITTFYIASEGKNFVLMKTFRLTDTGK